jgi:hypothetical protein
MSGLSPSSALSCLTTLVASIGRSLETQGNSSGNSSASSGSNQTGDTQSQENNAEPHQISVPLSHPFTLVIDALPERQGYDLSERLKVWRHPLTFFRTVFDQRKGLQHSVCDQCYDIALKKAEDLPAVSRLVIARTVHPCEVYTPDEMGQMLRILSVSGTTQTSTDSGKSALACVHASAITEAKDINSSESKDISCLYLLVDIPNGTEVKLLLCDQNSWALRKRVLKQLESLMLELKLQLTQEEWNNIVTTWTS